MIKIINNKLWTPTDNLLKLQTGLKNAINQNRNMILLIQETLSIRHETLLLAEPFRIEPRPHGSYGESMLMTKAAVYYYDDMATRKDLLSGGCEILEDVDGNVVGNITTPCNTGDYGVESYGVKQHAIRISGWSARIKCDIEKVLKIGKAAYLIEAKPYYAIDDISAFVTSKEIKTVCIA